MSSVLDNIQEFVLILLDVIMTYYVKKYPCILEMYAEVGRGKNDMMFEICFKIL